MQSWRICEKERTIFSSAEPSICRPHSGALVALDRCHLKSRGPERLPTGNGKLSGSWQDWLQAYLLAVDAGAPLFLESFGAKGTRPSVRAIPWSHTSFPPRYRIMHHRTSSIANRPQCCVVLSAQASIPSALWHKNIGHKLGQNLGVLESRRVYEQHIFRPE